MYVQTGSENKPSCYVPACQTSDPSFVTCDMSRIRHSDTQSLSRDHRPATRFRLSPSHGDTTQVREMVFINHGTWDRPG